MNGYFKVITDDKGVSIKLFPPTDGGAVLTIKEVAAYLDSKKIVYDLKALNTAIVGLNKETDLFLMDQKIFDINETCNIFVSADKMTVTARFYPPSTSGRLYDYEGIMSELRINRITHGADEQAINKFLAEREYCKDYIIANGTPKIEGKDAFITYNFPTDNKAKPTLNEDGTVDFYNLNIFNHVHVGDVLAVLTPEDRGQDGIDVMGNVIKPRDVKRMTLSYGLNIDISEDRTKIFSKVNGHVSLYNGKVFVSDVLEVENADLSTGNIDYAGNVKVNGNVCSNITIKSDGDVEVKGIVEGAFIEAKGNIILATGMNGMSKGILKAGGNVIAKFLENCTVIAGGYVETDSIMHSKVQAGTEVNVASRKGFIIGGSVSATNAVNVKTLGTSMGADTNVTVGIDPAMITRMQELTKQIEQDEKNVKMLTPVLNASKLKLAQGVKLRPDQIKQLQQLAITIKTANENIASGNAELESIREIMEQSTDAHVMVTGTVFPGTTITISDESFIIKDPYKFCKFIKDQGTVCMKNI